MSIEIPEEDAEYMYNFIDRIITDIGPRMPCSEPEAKAAEVIKNELEETCDSAHIEPFTCHPRAFLGWLRPVGLMVLGSFGIYFFLSSIITILAFPLRIFAYFGFLKV